MLALVPGGLRPYAKAVAPAVAGVLAAIIHGIATGEFGSTELEIALVAFLASSAAFATTNIQVGLRAYAKALTPAVLTVAGVLIHWAVTGDWNASEWAAAITGLGSALLSYLIPNQTPPLVHPAAAALEQIVGGDEPSTRLPLAPGEAPDKLRSGLQRSHDAAIREQLYRPLPDSVEEPPPGKVGFAHHDTGRRRVPHDEHYVNVAGRHGCRPGLARVIIKLARLCGIPVSLGFALIHHESGFLKVFGHDPTIFAGAGLVTRAKYLAYKAMRIASGNRLMQGVAEGQLTWWATQDAADRRGGCWNAAANIAVAFITLAGNIHRYGYALGIERYNGSGASAVLYSRQLRAEADVWHRWLTEGLS